ncbi:MAG: UDP-N-acetylmuramate dehydrogenase [Methylococcaceae bacterium]
MKYNTTGLRGELRFNEPMSDHTSWRVGGPARYFYLPADRDDLSEFLRRVPEVESLHWLGLGSNLLVRDGGIEGTVLCTRKRLRRLERGAANTIVVEAGVPCAYVARFCAEQNLIGGEFLAGIPGTMGGALAMNAGAFGSETWELVERVITVDKKGNTYNRDRSTFRIAYREVEGHSGEWFLACVLLLEQGDGLAGRQRIKSMLARRSASQPINLPSCGSVFRNPEGDHAARLIDAAGLKGYRIGDACVSEKHANFIINTGKASAADIETLMTQVQEIVMQRTGLLLKPEVRVVGQAK